MALFLTVDLNAMIEDGLLGRLSCEFFAEHASQLTI